MAISGRKTRTTHTQSFKLAWTIHRPFNIALNINKHIILVKKRTFKCLQMLRNLNSKLGAGELAQRLAVLTALPEDLGFILSSPVGAHDHL